MPERRGVWAARPEACQPLRFSDKIPKRLHALVVYGVRSANTQVLLISEITIMIISPSYSKHELIQCP